VHESCLDCTQRRIDENIKYTEAVEDFEEQDLDENIEKGGKLS
jgi:hypothetical protein